MNMNPYQPIQAEIVEIITESPTIKSFVIKPVSRMLIYGNQEQLSSNILSARNKQSYGLLVKNLLPMKK